MNPIDYNDNLILVVIKAQRKNNIKEKEQFWTFSQILFQLYILKHILSDKASLGPTLGTNNYGVWARRWNKEIIPPEVTRSTWNTNQYPLPSIQFDFGLNTLT